MNRSLYRKVGIASLIMMGSVFLSRIVGLLREMVIAYVGGAQGGVDAYQVAFIVPEILNHIAASGFLSVTFIPIFSKYLTAGREKEGWRIFSIITSCFGVMLCVLISLTFWLAPELVRILAPGLTDPALHAAAVRMTRIIMPAQFFFYTGGLLMAVQFSKERFFIPALAPLFYNLAIISGGLLLGKKLGMEGFAWGVLAGALAGNFLLQLFGARKAGMRFQLALNFRHPELRTYVVLTLPLMVGLTMTFSTEIFMKFFGSFLPEGRIAALNYSLRVMLVLVGLLGQAVGTASFPFMARMAAENRLDEMNHLLNQTLRFLTLMLPFSALFMVLRHEIILILFQRGRFDAAATEITAGVLLFLMVGACAFAAQTVVVRAYYAIQNTMFPAVFGSIAVLLSLPVYYLGMRQLDAKGVALGVSISAMLQVSVLYGLWNRRTQNARSKTVYRLFLKMTGLSIVLGGILEAVKTVALSGIDKTGLGGSLLTTLIISALFLPLLLLGGHVAKISEIGEVMRRLAKRLKKRERS